MEKPTIAILTHEMDNFESSPYYLKELIPFWEASGYRVTVVKGPRTVEADAAFLHVDLTVTPPEYSRLLAAYPLVVNGRVLDISKRSISSQLLEKTDSWEGKVIVKTDFNCGGERERRYASQLPLRKFWTRVLRRLDRVARRFGWRREPAAAPGAYQILDSLSAVPSRVWRDRAYVVERFLPEEKDGLYGLRTWTFFGTKETNSLSWSTEPIVKGRNIIRRELVEVPADLRERRRRLGFDYGKFDYVVRDGQSILFDANRTPFLPPHMRDALGPMLETMADGLADLVGKRTANTWSIVSEIYRLYGSPLRPAEPDQKAMMISLRPRLDHGPAPRVLMLGVTPALYELLWPVTTRLLAVDRSAEMIADVWPGRPDQARLGEWAALPADVASQDIVVTDGGLELLRWPDETAAVLREIGRVLVPRGLFAARVFIPPAVHEDVQDLMDALLAGAMSNSSEFKVRMWCALASEPGTGVSTSSVLDAVLARCPLDRLGAASGWTEDDVRLFETSCRAPGLRWMPSLDQLLALARSEGFETVSTVQSDAPWGYLCPTVTLRRV